MTTNGRLYEITSGNQSAVVAGVAAALLSWRVNGAERLLTHAAEELGDSYMGKTIVPWPNRINGGRYTFDGATHQVPVNEPDRGTALHGLLAWTEWGLVSHATDVVVLEQVQRPQYGYPFELTFRAEYRISADGLAVRLTARNTGSARAPFGAAHHPYLATTGEVELTIPAEVYYPADERLLPTGKEPVEGTPQDFRTARALGTTALDTAYTDLVRDASGHAVARVVSTAGATELWVDGGYSHLQVYTDDYAPAARLPRSGVTIEPMTCAPDAFNSGDGLIVLAPGAEWTGNWGYRAV
ncbi:aldose 1-epimerase [Crossiella equi]|uniref:Aldose 1-epimerase n=1 Tax=Crossiella equi TaxID=130796 RepID=A0ABS5A4N4_9PSEU|nr:aldose 1-epimerase family protein [Crossiella equi]MBP2471544.1 aldose 1-epimerase [Crossiella equi]